MTRRPRVRRSTALGTALAAACTFSSTGGSGGVGLDDTTTATVGTTTATVDPTAPSTTAAGTSSSTGSEPADTTMAPAEGSSGSTGATDATDTGGLPAGLVDCGLMTRHYLDEAADGIDPVEALDASGNGVHLHLEYDGNMAYDEVGGHRGLRWTTAGSGGIAQRLVAGTPVVGIDGSMTATIEAVVDIDAVVTSYSRIFHVGEGMEGGWLTLAMQSTDEVAFRQGTTNWGLWSVAIPDRVVLTVVYDTAQAAEAERLRLYVDGVRVPHANATGPIPDQGDTLELEPGNREIDLGNRPDLGRSIVGIIYYAASYGCALSDEEVAHNATILLADDDAPSA